MIEIDIITYLQSQSLGTIGTDLFETTLPDSPDFATAVRVYDADPTDLAWNGEYPKFQVIVRSRSHADGSKRIQEIYEKLHGVAEQLLNGKRYLLIQAIQPPFFLSFDKSGRRQYVANFKVIKEI